MNTQTEALGPIVVKVPKACEMLSASKTRLYELLAAGEIASIRDGKMRKILVASIHAYVDRQTIVGRSAK